MTARVARAVAAAVVVLCAVAAGVTLLVISRDGAMSSESVSDAFRYLLEFYLPLLGVISAFYLAERKEEETAGAGAISIESFTFAAMILFVWSVFLPLAFAFSDTYESAIELVNSLKLYGFTLAGAAVTFIFAKSSAA